MLITVRSSSTASLCPGCGTRSQRIHSRYQRRLADLPMAGKPVRIVVVARWFHCGAVLWAGGSSPSVSTGMFWHRDRLRRVPRREGRALHRATPLSRLCLQQASRHVAGFREVR
ncbi:transposase family protein [Mesorhizobium sp. M1328]|uniref:transposase family protein n=1 Tax=Mesorhizobium sp. M1328 TaxID=2957082 RepID=UPI00333DA82E